MKSAVALFLLFTPLVFAQHHHGSAPEPAVLESGLGDYRRPVSTRNEEAQKFFDQGIRFVYAFNHDEAIRSFLRAAELDPTLAMAHWGIAYALGPNINLDVDPEREKAAYEAVQKALALAKDAPEHERALVEALARRYSNDPKADLRQLSIDYKNAMGDLVKRYPDDLDVATLYAEAMMDLRPWKLWNKDGTPAEGTEEIVRVLESVLRRNPQHPGANHYYIHAVEASPTPERALPSAERLKTLIPNAGHLVHMPAHIYMRTGDYRGATEANAIAAEVDRAYIARRGSGGIYPMLYFNHNLHFLASAAAMEGRFDDAIRAARELEKNASPVAKEMTMIQGASQWPLLILVRFKRWNEILQAPAVDLGPQAEAIRRFARAVAYANTGKVKDAEREQKEFQVARTSVPDNDSFMLNLARDVLAVADAVLAGEIAETKGDTATAIEEYLQAAKLEDALAYDEPPDWPNPVRENLGALLLRAGRAPEAEAVFREDLERNPRSGRSLFGLMKALEAQDKAAAATIIRSQYQKAWERADKPLRLEDL